MDVSNLFSLSGKTALVTGGSRGIGAMIAEALVAAGASVLICGRKEAEVTQTATRLGAVPLVADLSTEAGVECTLAGLKPRVAGLEHVPQWIGDRGGILVGKFAQLSRLTVGSVVGQDRFQFVDALFGHFKGVSYGGCIAMKCLEVHLGPHGAK